jgi:cytochrome oxidase Cu insertion factor (SCO1/SenC/PrrC family)
MSNNFAAVDKQLQGDAATYDKTHLLTISFDPDYDTPKVMRSYGAGHTGRYSDETFQHWEFLTGSKDEVKGIAQFFGLRYFHDTESGDDASHSFPAHCGNWPGWQSVQAVSRERVEAGRDRC